MLVSERKDEIEDRNRIVIQNFQSQLTQQLELLHKTVAASVTQQEQQIKEMEGDMQSFVSTKTKVSRLRYDLIIYLVFRSLIYWRS